jgi:hypothetical protein
MSILKNLPASQRHLTTLLPVFDLIAQSRHIQLPPERAHLNVMYYSHVSVTFWVEAPNVKK